MCRQPHLSHDWFSSRITLEDSIFSIRNHLPTLRKTDRDYHLKSLESYNNQLLHSLGKLDFEAIENSGDRDLNRVIELSQELSKLIMVYR